MYNEINNKKNMFIFSINKKEPNDLHLYLFKCLL